MRENHCECARAGRSSPGCRGDRRNKKFVLSVQRDRVKIGRSRKAGRLTGPVFRGTASRACGPCRTAPAAFLIVLPENLMQLQSRPRVATLRRVSEYGTRWR